jgi:hypothetical protein
MPSQVIRSMTVSHLRCAKLDKDGTLSSYREEPIAADARPQSDGKEIAKHKVVAGLLGLGLDEITRRAERARKRRNRIRVGAAVATILVLVGGAVGWTAAAFLASRYDATQLLSIETDAADVCVRASERAAAEGVAEARRIAFAVRCVAVLSNDLDELSHPASVPLTFISAFEANIALLQKFKAAGELTPEQLEVLTQGEILLAQLKQRAGLS